MFKSIYPTAFCAVCTSILAVVEDSSAGDMRRCRDTHCHRDTTYSHTYHYKMGKNSVCDALVEDCRSADRPPTPPSSGYLQMSSFMCRGDRQQQAAAGGAGSIPIRPE